MQPPIERPQFHIDDTSFSCTLLIQYMIVWVRELDSDVRDTEFRYIKLLINALHLFPFNLYKFIDRTVLVDSQCLPQPAHFPSLALSFTSFLLPADKSPGGMVLHQRDYLPNNSGISTERYIQVTTRPSVSMSAKTQHKSICTTYTAHEYEVMLILMRG
jgi:hypothetical protein